MDQLPCPLVTCHTPVLCRDLFQECLVVNQWSVPSVSWGGAVDPLMTEPTSQERRQVVHQAPKALTSLQFWTLRHPQPQSDHITPWNSVILQTALPLTGPTATGRTATGTLHPPPRPAAQTCVTVTMLLAEGWPQWWQPRATLVTWTMTQSLCPHLLRPEASTCQQKRTMKAAHLLLTQRGATLITSTHHHPLPVQTPPEEGPSSSDCLQHKSVNTNLVEIWRGGRELLLKDEADRVQLKL